MSEKFYENLAVDFSENLAVDLSEGFNLTAAKIEYFDGKVWKDLFRSNNKKNPVCVKEKKFRLIRL